MCILKTQDSNYNYREKSSPKYGDTKRSTLRIIHEETIFDVGAVAKLPEFPSLYEQVRNAILQTDWPEGSGKFSIPPNPPKHHNNGVKPIKIPFMRYLKDNGWNLETIIDYGVTKRTPGPVDATHLMNSKLFAVEWETGNISSSHRSLSKMAIGLAKGILSVGILVLPSRAFYRYLTDRIGNYQELEPYFDLYKLVQCDSGLFMVIEVEHDELDLRAPQIPKDRDGNALYRERLTEIR